jgi:hypothetical protein
MVKLFTLVAGAAAAVAIVSAQPVVTVNSLPTTYTNAALLPTGVQVATTGSTTVTSTAQIKSASVCLDHTRVYWQYSDALVCPAPNSLAPANLACAWTDNQLSDGGGCVVITGNAIADAYSTVLWQVRYINGAEFGTVPGPRIIHFVATDINNLVSNPGNATINVVGDTTIAPCPFLNTPAGTISSNIDITAATAGTNGLTPVFPNIVVESANQIFQAHARIVEGCLPQDTLDLDYAGGAPLTIDAQFFTATCDLTLTSANAQTNATWTSAVRNINYRNTAAPAAVTLGVRGFSVFLGQNAPVVCNTGYGSSLLTIVTALPNITASVGPSPTTGASSVVSASPSVNAGPASSALTTGLSGVVALLLLGSVLAAVA